MFVYTVKASGIKLAAVLALSAAALIGLVAAIPEYEPTAATVLYADTAAYRYDGVKTEEDRRNFFRQFGWEVSEKPVKEENITIPGEFDKIFICYNELQKQQGLDLSKYRQKDALRYTYEITNYPDYSGKVYGSVIIYRGRVIGGDICSADVKGFVTTFDGKISLA